MSLAAGTKLGAYEVVAPLGAGGMGEVFRARDTRLGREVAIKALPAEFARDPERLERSLEERDPVLGAFRFMVHFDVLRGLPRFRELVAGIWR